jgi:RNA polymerase sigma-70 factor (ECF subfamily)
VDATSATLLDQLRSPNRAAAWVRFVNLFTPLLRHWAGRQGRAAAETADLVQTGLVKLMYEVPRYERVAGRPFRTWLAQVLEQAGHDYRRRRARGALPTPSRGAEVVGPADPPIEGWDEADYRQQLLRRGAEVVKSEFSPQLWAAFTGVVIEERSAAAVAAELKVPELAVYLARHRVLTRLHQELDGLLE